MAEPLPSGWVVRQGGDIWDAEGPKARPVAYRTAHGWMIVGPRAPKELQAIVDVIKAPVDG